VAIVDLTQLRMAKLILAVVLVVFLVDREQELECLAVLA
jgi:hypothetical protein